MMPNTLTLSFSEAHIRCEWRGERIDLLETKYKSAQKSLRTEEDCVTECKELVAKQVIISHHESLCYSNEPRDGDNMKLDHTS